MLGDHADVLLFEDFRNSGKTHRLASFLEHLERRLPET